jgi:ParB-like nuclease domain
MAVRFGLNNKNAKGRREAVEKAQKKLTLEGHPGSKVGDLHTVLVKPDDIGAIPEIFQPREFTFGARDHDRTHVKALTQTARNVGELEPVRVIKLKWDGWIVTEGHHRVEAYKALGRGDQEIKCEWFYGSVQEAAKESLKHNNIIKLNILQPDRMEEAWKWVLLGWGSKAQIVRACDVGEGTVATMRRAVGLAQLQDPEHKKFSDAEAFRQRLREWGTGGISPLKKDATPDETRDYLETLTWGIVGRLYSGVTKKEFDADEAAMQLVKFIDNRIGQALSRSPEITARALKILDAALPPQLMTFWRRDPEVDLDFDPYAKEPHEQTDEDL